jgi:hypothetical protein
MLENVSDTEGGGEPFDPGLDQPQVGRGSKTGGIQSLGFSAGDVTRGRATLGIRILVVPDQRLPVGVTRPLD